MPSRVPSSYAPALSEWQVSCYQFRAVSVAPDAEAPSIEFLFAASRQSMSHDAQACAM